MNRQPLLRADDDRASPSGRLEFDAIEPDKLGGGADAAPSEQNQRDQAKFPCKSARGIHDRSFNIDTDLF
jgi:hypothetical protein